MIASRMKPCQPVTTRKKKRQMQKFHTRQARFEKNFNHLQGDTGQLKQLKQNTLPQPQCQQRSTHLNRHSRKQIGKPVSYIKKAFACLAPLQTLKSTFLSEESSGASSVDNAESLPMGTESPRPVQKRAVGDTSSNHMKPSSQAENFQLLAISPEWPVVAGNERDVKMCFENTFQNGIPSSKLNLVQRPIPPLSKAANLPCTTMERESILSDLESKIHSASEFIQNSNTAMKQYMEGKFVTFFADLNITRSSLKVVKSNKFGKRENGVIDVNYNVEKLVPAIYQTSSSDLITKVFARCTVEYIRTAYKVQTDKASSILDLAWLPHLFSQCYLNSPKSLLELALEKNSETFKRTQMKILKRTLK